MSELAYPLEDTSDFHDRPFFQESDVEEVPETPSKSPPAPFSPGASDPYSALDSRHRQPFYIEVPYLSPEQKDLYGPVPDVLVESDEELEPFELRSVVGEYLTGGVHYYYAANTSGGLIRRFRSENITVKYPDLVKQYEKKKANGTLSPFDPSGAGVDPNSRVKLVLKLNKDQKSAFTSRDSAVYISSSSDDEEASDDASSQSSEAPPRRRSNRATTKSSSKRVNRLQRLNQRSTSLSTLTAIDSEADDRPVRRSTRNRKSSRLNPDAEYEGDSPEVVSVSSSSDQEYPAKKKKKKVVRSEASIPAYGNIRPIADLQLDLDLDDIFHSHRHDCEKCHQPPAYELLNKLSANRRKKAKKDEDDEDPEERYASLGGWVRCLKCTVCAHWSCLAQTQRDEILKAVLERDRSIWRAALPPPESTDVNGETAVAESIPHPPEPQKRAGLDAYQTTEFACGSCMRGAFCMGCKQLAVEPGSVLRGISSSTTDAAKEDQPKPATDSSTQDREDKVPSITRLFRCFTCKRVSHYEHLPQPPGGGYSNVQLAIHYQKEWNCADCASFIYPLEHILAWRPFPENAIEPSRPVGETPNYKANLPREYLVKWMGRSYRRIQWVPHGYLLATAPQKLRSFLTSGSRIKLLDQPVVDASVDGAPGESGDAFDIGAENAMEDASSRSDTEHNVPTDAVPDAEKRIHPSWRTVDRVLDVRFWYPEKILEDRSRKKKKTKRNRKSKAIENDSDDFDEATHDRMEEEYEAVFDEGRAPSDDFIETIDSWEKRTGADADTDNIELVVWAYFKWDELGYEHATWDAPPAKDDPSYSAFKNAFERYIASRSVHIKTLAKKGDKERHETLRRTYKLPPFSPTQQPQLGQSSRLSLMPFQVDGVNWLCTNYRKFQNCILADEMGLGKTVQVVTSLGVLVKEYEACPALVVVPNSTITNWVREFERWAPELRVCPFYGEAKARDVIKAYELYHSGKSVSGTTGAKFHVLVTTYETITNPKEFSSVFKHTSRWEILVIDEGQRLKNDSSLIFRKLRELNTSLRVILTGTPLNNNIRELFNLMNFLDPSKWTDLETLAKEHEELTEDRIKELHTRLRPYFLRRIKAEVLQLPPKNEVIVPVSMTPLQKEIYRSILSQNLDLLKNITHGNGAKMHNKVKKTNMNNMLMQLRKCLQHPYLVSSEIEPTGLSALDMHEKLIDASAKLRILKSLFPKLKARGHRVLLFSQFVIALDVIEDFLLGEGIKYLRLDGNTKQSDRQKGMDEFNKPDSDTFIYLLTTRAGGVGINLWSADTVIIFDPDFNPHQDLQAIARAHRYGQQKTCLVFKLMVKDSAEERIMQAGKKKLILDHLIVQKMDDDESREDVQSILMFGAKMLFEDGDQASKDIHYSEHDIDKLIEKTETEGDQQEQHVEEGSTLFSFAKVWSADKDSLEEIDDNIEDPVEQDSWAQTLQKIATERSSLQTQELTGRGVRRKAAAVFTTQQSFHSGDSPKKKEKHKKKHKSKATISDESDAYAPPPDAPSEGESSHSDLSLSAFVDLNYLTGGSHAAVALQPFARQEPEFAPSPSHLKPPPTPQKPSELPSVQVANFGSLPRGSNQSADLCGLCGASHPPGICLMTESSENLAEYREILILHATDEPLEDRRQAILVIDETLAKRNKLNLIYGQPLLLETPRTSSRSTKVTPIVAPPGPAHPPPKPKPRHSTISNGLEGQHAVPERSGSGSMSIPKLSTKPQPRPPPGPHLHTPSPKAGGSKELPRLGKSRKRSLSPPRPSSSKKRIKESQALCVICGQAPHLVHDCPVVKKGSKSTKHAIRKLEKDPSNDQIVHILRKILLKQASRELPHTAPPTIVVVSD